MEGIRDQRGYFLAHACYRGVLWSFLFGFSVESTYYLSYQGSPFPHIIQLHFLTILKAFAVKMLLKVPKCKCIGRAFEFYRCLACCWEWTALGLQNMQMLPKQYLWPLPFIFSFVTLYILNNSTRYFLWCIWVKYSPLGIGQTLRRYRSGKGTILEHGVTFSVQLLALLRRFFSKVFCVSSPSKPWISTDMCSPSPLS